MKPPICSNVSLKSLNTFGIDVKADYYTEVNSITDAQVLLNSPQAQHQPYFILGGGSNILFTQNVSGLLIRMLIPGIQVLREDAEHVWLKIGAGENWHQLVLHCVANNWGGIENLSLIPGTVGAAPIQNIGAYGVELKDVLEEVHTLRIADATLHVFTNNDCHFGYRNSIFKNSHKNQYIVCAVVLRLTKNPVLNLSYSAVADTVEKLHPGVTPSLRAVSDAVIHIRRTKLPDPNEIGNAGSFFKNPEISQHQFNNLQQQYPDMPHYSLSSEQVKIPAGWLIEQCGWKGKRLGNVGIYPNQALVIVNHGNATGEEVKQLAQQIQNSVYEKFAIEIIPEVNIV